MRIFTLLSTLFIIPILSAQSGRTYDFKVEELSPWSISLQYHNLYSKDRAEYSDANAFIKEIDDDTRSSFNGNGFIIMVHRTFGNFGVGLGASTKVVGSEFDVTVTDDTGANPTDARQQLVFWYLGVPVQIDYTFRHQQHGLRPFVGYEFVRGIYKFRFIDAEGDDYDFDREDIDVDWDNTSYLSAGLQYVYTLNPRWAFSAGYRGEWALNPVLSQTVAPIRTLYSHGFTLGVQRFL